MRKVSQTALVSELTELGSVVAQVPMAQEEGQVAQPQVQAQGLVGAAQVLSVVCVRIQWAAQWYLSSNRRVWRGICSINPQTQVYSRFVCGHILEFTTENPSSRPKTQVSGCKPPVCGRKLRFMAANLSFRLKTPNLA